MGLHFTSTPPLFVPTPGPHSPARARRQAPKISGETLESLDHYGRKLFLTRHLCARKGLCSPYT